MIRIAKTWFGLDDTLSTCIIDDGIQFLQQKVEELVTYDVIIFDVNNDDSQSPVRCPHPAFLDHQILENVKRLLSDDGGIFVLNFASRDDTNHEREDCLKRLFTNFDHVSSMKLDDDINEIIFASKQIALNSKTTGKISQENLSFNFDIEELLSKIKIEKN
jgi:spermidine synthase